MKKDARGGYGVRLTPDGVRALEATREVLVKAREAVGETDPVIKPPEVIRLALWGFVATREKGKKK